MSSKTGSNDKENYMESKNQLSNNNEKVNQNSTVDPTKLDNELKFKLNLNIRDKLIEVLNDYTSLFYGGDKNKEKIIEKSNDLMHNFVDLPLKEDQIKENAIDSIEPLKPTLIINSKIKTEITDLLLKNKNYFIPFNDDKDVKTNLINGNNNLVIKLMQFPIQMLKEDDPVNNDYVWKRVLINESNHTVDDLLMAKSKYDEEIVNYKKELLELKEKISILKKDQLNAKSEFDEEIANYKKELLELKEKISKSNALSTNKKESAFRFLEIGSFHHFYKQDSGKINTLPFECSGLEFMINIQNSSKYFYFELALLNKLDINRNVKATCQLILINNKQIRDKENIYLNLDLVFTQNQLFQSKGRIYKDSLFYNRFYHTNDALQMKVNLTAELIKLVD